VSLLQYKINEYKVEKEKLVKKLAESKTDKHDLIDKIEKEIKSYKNMADTCIKTCSQLAEELIFLRKEIEKYTGSNSGVSNASGNNGNNSVTRNKSISKNLKK
jgi:hypothetical protein